MFNLFKKKECIKPERKTLWTAELAEKTADLNVFTNTLETLDRVNDAIEEAVRRGESYMELYRKTPNNFYCHYARKLIDVDYLDSVLIERGFEIRLVETGEFGRSGMHYLVWGEVEL